jgi:hypothetical protein
MFGLTCDHPLKPCGQFISHIALRAVLTGITALATADDTAHVAVDVYTYVPCDLPTLSTYRK